VKSYHDRIKIALVEYCDLHAESSQKDKCACMKWAGIMTLEKQWFRQWKVDHESTPLRLVGERNKCDQRSGWIHTKLKNSASGIPYRWMEERNRPYAIVAAGMKRDTHQL
jgi:hypothetical protein